MSLDRFLLLLQAHGLPLPETEVTFHPTRKWRADYLFRSAMVIVEREGGLWAKGRAGMAHAMPSAILRDMERSNAAQILGFVYLRFTPQQLESGEALPLLKLVLGRAA